MATRPFPSPPLLVALRITPLISTTCTLLYARDQDFFLRLFNHPASHRTKSRALLPSYWQAFFRRGIYLVVGCLGATFWSCVANLYVRRAALHARGSFWSYAAAAGLSVGHLLFVPAVAPSVKAIWDAEEEGTDANKALDEWLWVNKVRMWTVDLAGWVACVVAVTRTLEA
ncbi:hypothetical protein F5144DRAFT_542593 [Chaetomium tenue]|uniref:Uncharacterized protein n=1 Tax=Chaetomium tenue TaxID=1854479 RepID=A0ACB7PKT2_9PEZI|nr:hypothetical protein F5144DRAFT_542593 [Chaetomium globosum]